MKRYFQGSFLLLAAAGFILAQDTTPVIPGNVVTTGSSTYAAGTTQAFSLATASNLTVVNTITTSNLTVSGSATLPAISSAAVSTNTANMGISRNSLALNRIQTNGAFRTFLSATIILDSTLTQPATVALQTLDAGSTNTISIISDNAGVVESNTMTCVGWVNPNQVFCFSNFSGAGAVATMITNTVWQF